MDDSRLTSRGSAGIWLGIRLWLPTVLLIAGATLLVWLRTPQSEDPTAIAGPLAAGFGAVLVALTWYGALVGARVGHYMGAPFAGRLIGGAIAALVTVWSLAAAGLGSAEPILIGWAIVVTASYAALAAAPPVSRSVPILAVAAWALMRLLVVA